MAKRRLPDGHPPLHRRRAHGRRPGNRTDVDASALALKIAGVISEAGEPLGDDRRDAVVPAIEMPDQGEDGLGRQSLEFDPDLVKVLVLLPEPPTSPSRLTNWSVRPG